jgi:hypothetical protein
MTIEELIKKLETFPPEDRLRFYCPKNKTYYYVYGFTEVDKIIFILLLPTITNIFGSKNYISWKQRIPYCIAIDYLKNVTLTNVDPDPNIIFIYENQLFVPL